MVRYIPGIKIRFDYNTVFARLGYKKSSTQVSGDFRNEIAAWIDEAAAAVKLEAAVIKCGITVDSENSRIRIFPENGPDNDGQADNRRTNGSSEIEIESKSLCKFLAGHSRILLMGITGGSAVMELIDSCQKNNMTKAVVLDAAAGEMVDNGLDFIISLVNRELARESGRLLSKRFSPGYGDLSLIAQREFYHLLEMEKLGVTLTESFMLVPQKSVIALTGIVY